MKNIEKQNLKYKCVNDTVLILIPSLIILIVEIFFKIFTGGSYLLLKIKLPPLLFSLILGNIIYVLLLCILKKNSTTCSIFSIMNFILLIINQIKISYTAEPIYYSDIKFFPKVFELISMIIPDIGMIIKSYLIPFIILLIIFILVIKWVKKKEVKLENKKIRLILVTAIIIILMILYIPNKNTKNIYLNLIFNINEYKDYNSYTTNLTFYQYNTLLSGMYGVMLNNRFDEPENYDKQKLSKIIEDVEENIEKKQNLEKPNIIILFSEAFWDINKIEEIQFDKKITTNFDELKQQGKNVELLSCSYGGMSENVAFELLTGGSINYFTKGYIPIMSLYSKNNSNKIPSIIKELKRNQYTSKIIFGKDYYNSKKAFEKIGFDEYILEKQVDENIKGNQISDEYMVNSVIKQLENKNNEEKVLYMIETIQNHLPYGIEKYDKYDINIKTTDLSTNESDILLSYAQGIYDADKALGILYKYIKDMKEPTILIFLGDHLPYLYSEDEVNLLEKLKYFNTSSDIENIYRKYTTPCLILSNYDIDYEKIPECLSDDLLLTYIINNMDINISSYYKWLYSTINDLPAMNSYIGIEPNGTKRKISDFSGKILETYELRKLMQYKYFLDTVM